MPMLFVSLPSAVTALPLHSQLMLAVILASGLLCFGVVGMGGLRSILRPVRIDGLPPTPPAFPYLADQLYTALFVIFLLYSAASSLFPAEASAGKAVLTWGTIILSIASHLLLYSPMLVRYVLVYPWQQPRRPWWHYLALPVLVWGGIYVSIISVEASGFSAWLIEQTQCPEHQDLVTAFAQGDLRQRLYIGLSAVIVAPLVEECCFRGFLYNILKRWGGCGVAVLASSLLFGAIHSSLAQMLPLTLFGAAQCLAYEKVRSLWLPIAVHALFNSVSLITTVFLMS